ADASNPQTLNSYSYVLNNPLKYTDPTGQSFTDFDTHDEFDLGENERTEIDFLTGNEGMAMDRVKRDAERVDRVLAGEGTISDRDIAHAMGRLTLGESVNIGFEVDTVNNADFRSTLFSFIINNFGENNYLRNGLIGAGVWGGLGLLTAGPFGFLVGGVSGFFFGAVGTFYVHELIKNPSTVFWHFYTDKNTPTPDRNSNGVADVFE
ncbi:MAG: hypothetical protein Q7T03_03055, partial [Deltaproteobacteria bacterium]|nr:hypothetical protein [Deltaproteobacteria bacterium]